MIFILCGLQSVVRDWCQEVCGELLRRSVGDVRVCHVSSGQDLLRETLRSSSAILAMVSRPDKTLYEAVRDSGAPLIVAAASPADSLVHLRSRTNTASIELVREVLADTATLTSLLKAERKLQVPIDEVRMKGAAWVQNIASCLGIEVDRAVAADLADRLAFVLDVSETALSSGPVENDRSASREDEVCVRAALGNLNEIVYSGKCNKIVATRRLFLAGDTHAPPLEPIDATGRGRTLIFGPYLQLPEGDWTARCVYGFSPELKGTPLSVDVAYYDGISHQLAKTSFEVTSAGRMDVSIRFRNPDPSVRLEVRLFCDRSIFDGQVSIGFVEFTLNDGEGCFEDLVDLVETVNK